MSETQTVETKPNLVTKLARIMGRIESLKKSGVNTAQGYQYATEADVAELLRKELSEANIFIFPNMVSSERNRIEKVYKGDVTYSYTVDVVMEWTFEDGDSGEKRVCRIPGCSASPGDKGVYVSMTGSEKYLLMKSFLIPTYDDPEHDSNEPRGTQEAANDVARKGLEKSAQSPDPKIRKIAEDGLAKLNGKAPQNGSLYQQKPINTPPPPSAPAELLPPPIDPDLFDHAIGHMVDVRKGPAGMRFVKVEDAFGVTVELSTFDMKLGSANLYDFLDTGEFVNAPVDFAYVEKDGKGKHVGKKFKNILAVSRIGATHFDADGNQFIKQEER